MSACLRTSLLCGAILAFSGLVFGAAPPTSRSGRAPSTGSPAAWLWDAGKSDDWKSATARCRDLLDRLDLQSDSVKKHLAKVKEKVQLLLCSPGLDWKKQTAIDYLENLLADGRAGDPVLVAVEGAAVHGRRAVEVVIAIQVALGAGLRVLFVGAAGVAVVAVGELVLDRNGDIVYCCDTGC